MQGACHRPPKTDFENEKYTIILYLLCTILYTKSQILYTLPSCAIGNSNLGPGGTWCTKFYKLSTKLWSSFLSWNCISGGCISPAPQMWIADSARRKDVQNLGLGVQNCTKWVQNYDTVFYVETAFGGCMSPTPTPKFKLLLAEGGRIYKIFGAWCTKLYKMSTKLWYSFLCWNGIWGMHVSHPHPKI